MIIEIAIPSLDGIKKMTDLEALEDYHHSAVVQNYKLAAYIMVLEDRIRELRKCQSTV